MKISRRSLLASCLAIPFASLISLASLQAAPTTKLDDEPKEIVRFRCTTWKTVHLEDREAAERMAETFKRIGCEAEANRHSNHYDVRYRCLTWKAISLSTHEDAHRWEEWLKGKGFETSHEH